MMLSAFVTSLLSLSFIWLGVSGTPTQEHFNVNLTDLMLSSDVQGKEVFNEALQIIKSLEFAPSCNRLAAANLLHSCKNLESTVQQENAETALEFFKSIFAARLAVCELTGANAAIPTQCRPLVPQKDHNDDSSIFGYFTSSKCEHKGKEGNFCFTNVDSQKLATCLGSLESRPQWWTSYSNARQNAIVLCHVARSEVERDELITVHKSMAEAVDKLTQSASQSLLQYGEEISRNERFAGILQKMQREFIADMKTAHAKAVGNVNSLASHIEEKFRLFYLSIVKGADETAQKESTLQKALEKSNRAMEGIGSILHNVTDNMTTHITAVSKQHSEQLQYNHDLAIAVGQALTDVREKELQTLQTVMVGLQIELKTVTEVLRSIVDRHSSLDSRVGTLETSIVSIASQLENFNGTFAQFATHQFQTLEETHAYIRHMNQYARESADLLEALKPIVSFAARGLDYFKLSTSITIIFVLLLLVSAAKAVRFFLWH